MNAIEFEGMVSELNAKLAKRGDDASMTVRQLIEALQELPEIYQDASTGATYLEVEPFCVGRQVYTRPDGTQYMSQEVMDVRIHIHGA